MKTRLILQLTLFVMLLAEPSEEFFFDPKKAFMEFLQSLRAKKQPPKMDNIHHYHLYYYPFPMLAWKAPDKQDLEKLYDDTLKWFGWSNHQHRYLSEPSMIITGLQPLWEDTDPWDQEILGADDVETIDRNSKGVLVQVPINQQIVFRLLKKLRKQTN